MTHSASRILAMARPPGRESGSAWQASPLGVDLGARNNAIDQVALRAWRLERFRAELRKRDYAGALLADPINIRYATGTRNMSIWTLHAPAVTPSSPPKGRWCCSSSPAPGI